jgi:hypothetical protein
MPTDGRWEKAIIETGAGTPQRGGGTSRSGVPTEAWTRWFMVSAAAAERYKSLDKAVEYRVELRSHHTLSLEETRIVRTSDGGRVYEPVASPEVDRLHGEQTLLVRWTGKRVSYLAADVAAGAEVEAGVTA